MIREHSYILDHWHEILGQVGAGIDLEGSAGSHRAFVRPRKIASVPDLFRLCLSYGCGLSLRAVAGFAGLAELGDVSAPGLLHRLSNCGNWLEAVALSLLHRALPQATGAFCGKRLLVVDTTSICHPGASTASFRLHMRFDLSGNIDGIDFSDGCGAEHLTRFDWSAGDIVLADRGLTKALDLEQVLAGGADFVVRAGWNALKWLDHSGLPLEICTVLETIQGDAATAFAVRIKPEAKSPRSFPARLIVQPLPADKAEAARKKARKKARKNGKKIDERTLLAAGFLIILTSLPESFAAADIAAFYRLRWQIELLFKRLKSLSGLGQLPAKNPKLAKTWIYAKLIIAILAETAAHKLADSPPSGPRCALSGKAGLDPGPTLPRPHQNRNSRHAAPRSQQTQANPP